jgi:hypothetical protein
LVSGAEVALFSLSQTEVDETTQKPFKGKIISSYWKTEKLALLVANNFINIK